ncbi:hypothetical protein SCA6_000946 [Theobroma cacao]
MPLLPGSPSMCASIGLDQFRCLFELRYCYIIFSVAFVLSLLGIVLVACLIALNMLRSNVQTLNNNLMEYGPNQMALLIAQINGQISQFLQQTLYYAKNNKTLHSSVSGFSWQKNSRGSFFSISSLSLRSALAWLTSSTSSQATLHSSEVSSPSQTSLASVTFFSIISASCFSLI